MVILKKFLVLLVVSSILFSCKGDAGDELIAQEEAKGDVIYGGVFRYQSPEKVEGLFPLSGTNAFTRNITYQIFETLLKTNLSNMRTEPSLAKSFSVDETGKKYTLILRKGVYFHSDECFEDEERQLTIDDVKYSLELACSNLPINKMSYLLMNRIKGAKSFYRKSSKTLSSKGVSGIKILNDSTLQIELTEPFSGFEKILAHSNLCIVAKEAIDFYGAGIDQHPIGTGPFQLDSKNDSTVKLRRFNRYWRRDALGNKLPYLDGVEMTYSSNKKNELQAFRDEKLECVLNIPVDEINYVLGTLEDAQQGENVVHRVLSEPSMSVMYMGYACESKEFSDPRVRQAFNLAVDRNEIVNSYMGGEGWPALHGFIPPLDFYPNDDVKPFQMNVEKAKELLAEAGFPEGKNFPPVEIYVNAQENSPNHNMVRGVVDQIALNLNVPLSIKLCSIGERDRAIASGKAKMWRAGWIADYAHPENFLSLFYSRNIGKNNYTINSFHFVNKEFDAILEQANREMDEAIRNQLFVICDQMIVDQAVVMPILTEDFIVLVNSRVKNFVPNSLELLDFSSIFMKKPRK